MTALFDDWMGLRRFKRMARGRRDIVFYSEGRGNWPHLEPLLHHITVNHQCHVIYLSSSKSDPGLQYDNPLVTAYCIGAGIVRAMLFRTLDAGVMVMTTPNLNNMQLRRSVLPVHYIYVHHSIVSTHMIYRERAFDAFDTVFCVGPHHVREIRETEQLYNLPPKELFEHGYGRLDAMMLAAGNISPKPTPESGSRVVLIAPSWGSRGLLEGGSEELVTVLLEAGYRVIVRPHPVTSRDSPTILASIKNRFKENPAFSIDEEIESFDTMARADIMISDWSGAAMEFAFAFERPVLFIDVPRKVNNKKYKDLNSVPLEVSIRQELGLVLSPDHYNKAPQLLNSLLGESELRKHRIRGAREHWCFNLNGSGAKGAARIVALANGRKDRKEI